LTAAFPAVSGIMLNVNDRNTNVVLGERYILLWGSEYLEDTLLGKRFRIAPAAFYQVNRRGAELLYSKALELAVRGKSTSSLVDLYCGTGTIGICMAEKFGRLVGVDIVPASVECARENARLNGINNASFYCADAGDARSILNCVRENGVHLHDATVVIDPPRKGTTAELISMLAEGGCPRVVYVSCDPDTLARDAAVFISHGYSISEIQPVDMFPRTGHVECVVLMTGSKNKL
ncbi:MAG: 23S rRNA (uracil(1939)-C(5))-methyltransferase RlmD, partial [Eubacteriales bacterium]